ncbi:MAG: hypothetical protein IJU89_04645 [Alphaproteobacteria bacterium]|nr:hypothetical protein [Alphaproteobacteria bacterium]
MSKKQKFYNPYRYKSMIVMYPGRGEIRKFYKEKSTKHMHMLEEHEQQIVADMINETNSETQKSPNKSVSPENADILVKKYMAVLKPISAEYVADFLIANNIARRGKILHASNAINAMKQMHKKTHSLCAITYQWHICDCKITDLSFTPTNCEHDLAYFLHHKYNVLLLNQHTYNHICEKVKTGNKESHYKNLLKKFYAADINPKTYRIR